LDSAGLHCADPSSDYALLEFRRAGGRHAATPSLREREEPWQRFRRTLSGTWGFRLQPGQYRLNRHPSLEESRAADPPKLYSRTRLTSQLLSRVQGVQGRRRMLRSQCCVWRPPPFLSKLHAATSSGTRWVVGTVAGTPPSSNPNNPQAASPMKGGIRYTIVSANSPTPWTTPVA
jgi:hypothetical protein